MNRILFLFIFAILTSFQIQELICQTVVATYPVSSATDISIDSPITFVLSHPIDSSSIIWNWDKDDNDSIIKGSSSIVLMPTVIHSITPDSLKELLSIKGSISIDHDSLLVFHPHKKLSYATEYVCYYNNINLITQINDVNDTISVDSDTAIFTTIHSVHDVLYTNIMNHQVLQFADTINIYFNRPLDSIYSPQNNPIASIYRIDTSYVQNGNIIDSLSLISSHSWINSSDSTTLSIVPTHTLASNIRYLLHIPLFDFVGDSTHDYTYPFFIQNQYKLKLTSNINDTLSSSLLLPSAGEYYYRYTDTFTIAAFHEDSSYIFHHWISNIGSLSQSTSSVVDITVLDAKHVDSIYLEAVFYPKQDIQVVIDSIPEWPIAVYSSTGDYLGSSGIYNLSIDDYYTVETWNTTNKPFIGWSSNDGRISLSNQSIAIVSNNGKNINLFPIGGPTNTPVNNGVCAFAFVEDNWSSPDITGTGGDDPTNIISVTPDSCIFVGASTTQIPVSAWIHSDKQDCFCIAGVIIKPPNGRIQKITLECVPSASVAVTPTSPPTAVYFIVERKGGNYKLIVDTEVENIRNIDEYGPSEASKKIGIHRDVTVGVFRVNRSGARNLIGYTDEDLNNGSLVTIQPCYSKIQLVTYRNMRSKGYSFNEWANNINSPPSPGGPSTIYNTFSFPPEKEQFTFVMDRNRSAKAVFAQEFHLRKIGVFQNDNSNDYVWYTPDQFRAKLVQDIDIFSVLNEGTIGRFYENAKFGTKIAFEFDDNVDIASLYNNLNCRDATDRPDLLPRYIYPSNANQFSASTSSDKIIEFDLFEAIPSTSVLGLSKGTLFNLSLTNKIKSQSGDNLFAESTGEYMAYSELPGAIITIEEFTAKSGMGDLDGDPEVMIASNTIVINTPSGTYNEYRSKYPLSHCYYSVDVNERYIFEPITPIFVIEELKHHQFITLGMKLSDIDGETCCEIPPLCVGSWVTVALLGLGAALSAKEAFFSSKGYTKAQVISLIVAVVILTTATIIAFIKLNPPDTMGEGGWSYTWKDDWWGAHPSVSDHEMSTSNIDWEIDVWLQ